MAKEILTFDDVFMAMALLIARRSKDPNTQVGACLVSEDNRILSTGYNGTPNGWDDQDFYWQRDGHPLENKYLYVIHAERNAILNYKGSHQDLRAAKIYVSLFPCNECAKEIIQAGITEVVYLSDKYADSNETKAAKKMFDMCNVAYRKYETCINQEIKLVLKD